jgi:ribosomal protein L37AE/L43A
MSGYDTWLTTPPDDRGYCPNCHASTEDDDRGADGWHCVHCGAVFSDPLSHAEMLREGREEARLDRADL